MKETHAHTYTWLHTFFQCHWYWRHLSYPSFPFLKSERRRRGRGIRRKGNEITNQCILMAARARDNGWRREGEKRNGIRNVIFSFSFGEKGWGWEREQRKRKWWWEGWKVWFNLVSISSRWEKRPGELRWLISRLAGWPVKKGLIDSLPSSSFSFSSIPYKTNFTLITAQWLTLLLSVPMSKAHTITLL